jgi:hypothetical protein
LLGVTNSIGVDPVTDPFRNFWPDPENIIADPDPGSARSEINDKLIKFTISHKMHDLKKIIFFNENFHKKA